MKNCCPILLFLFFYGLSPFLFSQQHIFEHQLLTTEDGLPNLNVSGIHKDKRGFMWIGTDYGLSRYDGYTFKHYSKETSGLIDNMRIVRIAEDDEGHLWLYYWVNAKKEVGTHLLSIFDPIQEKAIPIDKYFTHSIPFDLNKIRAIKTKDPQKRLWVTTREGDLFIYQKKKFKKIFEQKGILFKQLSVDDEGLIWLISREQVFCINLEGEIQDNFTLSDPILGLWLEEGGKIWVASHSYETLKTEVYYKKKKAKDLSLFNFVHQDTIIKVSASIPPLLHRDNLGYWYGTYKTHLAIFDKNGQWQKNIRRHNDSITFCEYDDEKTLWFNGNSLLKVSKRKNPFHLIHAKPPILSNCRGITEDELGNIYFYNHGIYKWFPQEQQTTYMPKLPTIHQQPLLYQDNVLYTGGYLNMTKNKISGYHVNLATNKIVNYLIPIDKDFIIYCLVASNLSNRILVGTDQGLGHIDTTERRVVFWSNMQGDLALVNLLNKSTVKYIHQNADGIWLATTNGIFLVNENKEIQQHFKAPEILPHADIQHIYEDKQGVFWLASRGGGLIKCQFNIQNPSSSVIQQFTTKDGLSNDYLYAVYEDNDNRLWIPSDKGLMAMDKETALVKIFLTEDGLPHNEFNFSSHYQAKDGTLYFGGLGGLISFHPSTIPKDFTSSTPLVVTSFQVLEGDADEMKDQTTPFKEEKKIVVHPTDKLFELKFTLLDYFDPEQHRYAYQIEGYANQWQQIEENFIRLTNLPYGNYTINVKGQHTREGWSSEELSIPVEVRKPFYLQWWFLLLLLALIVGLSLAAFKWRLAALTQQKKILEEEVQKRTKTISTQAEALKQLDKAKTRFFSNITHEFRTPLTLIIGPLGQLKEKKPSIQKEISPILKNAKHLLTLVNQLLDLSKLESGQMRTEVVHGDLVKYTRELTYRFIPLAHKKFQELFFYSELSVWNTYFDKKKWDKIIYNLLSNAIKFTPENGKVQVFLNQVSEQEQETIQLIVEDTGIGIEPTTLQNIFNRFYQADNSSTRHFGGTGIGLALVKELVELQNGTVHASSQVGIGTTFKILLPVSPIATTSIPILEQTPALMPELMLNTTATAVPAVIEKIPTSKNGKKLDLLIIEDNAEMRHYIQTCLDKSQYNIIKAQDGQEGIEKTLEVVPDLIISDIMMPRKNGFEVVETIRKHVGTSHIPIILLTAKASLESRLEGIARGADVYLTKPFSPKELVLRIEKLIELRQLLRQRYQNEAPSDANPTFQQEDTFISELRNFIQENIDDVNLDVKRLSQHFGISRTQLYRKLDALVGKSVAQFIRLIRLEKAKELLAQGELNVTEITYATGFSSPSHFARTFKKVYGKAPSEMI